MDVSIAAYRKLLAMANADGELSADERELLERYRIALGVAASEAPGALRAGKSVRVPKALVDAEARERAHVVRMLAGVAYADGRLHHRERLRLASIAEFLGVGRVELASILGDAEHHARVRSAARRSALAVALVAVVAVVALVWREATNGAPEARFALLEARIDGLDLEQARANESEVRASWDELEGARARTFQEIERRTRGAVVLVVVHYRLVRGRESTMRQGVGSGFFVSPDGLIVTNKHVLQPWKFSGDVGQRLADGWRLDEASVRFAAWTAGSPLFDARGELDFASAWDSAAGTLSIAAMPADRIEERAAGLHGGGVHVGEYHALDDADLALLQARVERPVCAFPLAPRRDDVGTLDPVLVLGFPWGTSILEGRQAVASSSVGVVRNAQENVYVTAPIVMGNSGGPVVDADGHVVAIATRTVGDSSMGCCIRIERVLPLLPSAQELRARAARLPAEARTALEALAALR